MRMTKEELEELRQADEEIDREFAEAFPEDDGTDLKLDILTLSDRIYLRPRPYRCVRQLAYYYRNHASIAAYKARYYREHREKCIAKNAKYYAEHKDLRKLRYLANKDAALEYQRRHYTEHRDEILEKQKEYRAAHRDEITRKRQEKREALRLARQEMEAMKA